MEKNQSSYPVETKKRLCGTEMLQTNIPAQPPVQILIISQLTCSIIETHLIEEQTGFCPAKSTIGQLLNLTQCFKDGDQKKKITGAVFLELTAVNDTMNFSIKY